MITNRVEQAQEAQATRPPETPLGRLGWWSMRHRWLVVVGWVAVLVVMTVAGRLAGSQFKTDLTGGNTQSQQAAAFLRERFPAQAGDTVQVVFAPRAPTPALTTAPANPQRLAVSRLGPARRPEALHTHKTYAPKTLSRATTSAPRPQFR